MYRNIITERCYCDHKNITRKDNNHCPTVGCKRQTLQYIKYPEPQQNFYGVIMDK